MKNTKKNFSEFIIELWLAIYLKQNDKFEEVRQFVSDIRNDNIANYVGIQMTKNNDSVACSSIGLNANRYSIVIVFSKDRVDLFVDLDNKIKSLHIELNFD